MVTATDAKSNAITATPPLTSRHVVLRPIGLGDYGWLHAASCSGDLAMAWRFRGATPSPETFARTLWEGVLAQYLVVGHSERGSTPGPIGHVCAYNPDLQSGTVYFAVTGFPPYLGTGLALEGGLLFLNLVFSAWRIRKIYVETTPEALSQYQSGMSILREEGRLFGHEFVKGAYVDRLILAMYRADFRDFLSRFASLFPVTFKGELP